jgi:hypothetical protein
MLRRVKKRLEKKKDEEVERKRCDVCTMNRNNRIAATLYFLGHRFSQEYKCKYPA